MSWCQPLPPSRPTEMGPGSPSSVALTPILTLMAEARNPPKGATTAAKQPKTRQCSWMGSRVTLVWPSTDATCTHGGGGCGFVGWGLRRWWALWTHCGIKAAGGTQGTAGSVGTPGLRATQLLAGMGRVRIIELKYIVLQPVYTTIRAVGVSLRFWQAASSKQQAASSHYSAPKF